MLAIFPTERKLILNREVQEIITRCNMFDLDCIQDNNNKEVVMSHKRLMKQCNALELQVGSKDEVSVCVTMATSIVGMTSVTPSDSHNEQLYLPSANLLCVLRESGAQGDIFTKAEMAYFIKEYIYSKELLSNQNKMVVHCDNDALEKVFSVKTFPKDNILQMLEKVITPITNAQVKGSIHKPSIQQQHRQAKFAAQQKFWVQKQGNRSKVDSESLTAEDLVTEDHLVLIIEETAETPGGDLQNTGRKRRAEKSSSESTNDSRAGRKRRSPSISIVYSDFEIPLELSQISDESEALSIQSKETVWVKDSSDDAWFLDDNDDDSFSMEYEPDSEQSDPYSDTDSSSGDSTSEDIVLYYKDESDVGFLADFSSSESDSDDISDLEISPEDNWACSECDYLNAPFSRYCDRCWETRPGWVPETSVRSPRLSRSPRRKTYRQLRRSLSAPVHSPTTNSESDRESIPSRAPLVKRNSKRVPESSHSRTFVGTSNSARHDMKTAVDSSLHSANNASTVTSVITPEQDDLDLIAPMRMFTRMTSKADSGYSEPPSSQEPHNSQTGSAFSQQNLSQQNYDDNSGKVDSIFDSSLNSNHSMILSTKELGFVDIGYDEPDGFNDPPVSTHSNPLPGGPSVSNSIPLSDGLNNPPMSTQSNPLPPAMEHHTLSTTASIEGLPHPPVLAQTAHVPSLGIKTANVVSDTTITTAAGGKTSVGRPPTMNLVPTSKVDPLSLSRPLSAVIPPKNATTLTRTLMDPLPSAAIHEPPQQSHDPPQLKRQHHENWARSRHKHKRNRSSPFPMYVHYPRDSDSDKSQDKPAEQLGGSKQNEEGGACSGPGPPKPTTSRQEGELQPPSGSNRSSFVDVCAICLTKPKDASIIHGKTGHQVCCYKCAKKLLKRRKPCPVCRRPIENVIKNFLA
ncbi:unnamed protein product [Owenia fusiformis]|uniref:Uncharacterized protein n=1 Tax=Owenia fusiformis TaxID=6347 RepID=A0A8J1TC64_OWEFU|nr:unnamed protein product [Owenia fusiformis]